MKDYRAKLKERLRRARDPRQKVDVLNALARETPNWDIVRSHELTEEAYRIAAGTGYDEGMAYALANRGFIRARRGDFGGAFETLNEALQLFEELGDSRGIATVRIAMGLTHSRTGDAEEAFRCAEEGLQRMTRLGDTAGRIGALLALADAYLWLGSPDRGLAALQEALDLMDESGIGSRRELCLIMIGQAHFKRNDLPSALLQLEEAIEVCRKNGNDYDEQRALVHIGNVYTSFADYPKALDCYLRALEIDERIGASHAAAIAIGSMSEIYITLHNHEKTLELLQKIIRSEQPHVRALAALNMGRIHLDMGNIDAAWRYCRESLDIASGSYARHAVRLSALKLMGDLALSSGDQAAAEEYYVQTLALPMDVDVHGPSVQGVIAEAHLALGRLCLLANDHTGAIERFTQTMNIADGIGGKGLLRAARAALCNVYEQRRERGDIELAFEHFKEASRLNEEILGAEKQRAISTLETRAQIEQARIDRERYRLENERLQRDMERKAQELNAMAVHLTQKDQLLNDIRRELIAGGGVDAPVIRSVLSRIQQNARAEKGWQIFEKRLEEVHGGFLAELSRRFPALTPAELKVCALLKTQLPSKEIASLLSVSARAVEKHRWNIRKKLGLSPEINLVSFLAAL